MFVSTLVFTQGVTNEPEFSLPFTIDPVTGEFTAGQTVTATASGLTLAVPFQMELLDEENTLALFTTSIQLNAIEGLEPFSFAIPTTLR